MTSKLQKSDYESFFVSGLWRHWVILWRQVLPHPTQIRILFRLMYVTWRNLEYSTLFPFGAEVSELFSLFTWNFWILMKMVFTNTWFTSVFLLMWRFFVIVIFFTIAWYTTTLYYTSLVLYHSMVKMMTITKTPTLGESLSRG